MIKYLDVATIYEVGSGAYAGDKSIIEYAEVPCILMRGSAYQRLFNAGQEAADLFCYIDPNNTFCSTRNYKLEGMSVLISSAWYIIVEVKVHRHHLLNSQIDNVELLLNKSSALDINVS